MDLMILLAAAAACLAVGFFAGLIWRSIRDPFDGVPPTGTSRTGTRLNHAAKETPK